MQTATLTTPMSMNEPNLIPMITRLNRIGKVYKKTRNSLRKTIDLPRVQPARRDGWLV